MPATESLPRDRVDQRVLALEMIGHADRFGELREEWTDLLRNSSSNNPFLTWEWLYAWSKHLGDSSTLQILAARECERLVGVAPLCVTRGRLPWLSQLEFLGTGWAGSDYLDLIARRGYEGACSEAFGAWLRSSAKTVRFDHLQPDALAATLGDRLADEGWSRQSARSGICPFATLRGHSWETYVDTLSPSQRTRCRRYLNTLRKKFDVGFERVDTESRRREALSALMGFHDQRWTPRGGSTAFQTPALQAFHHEATSRTLDAGWLRLFVLRLNDEIAAVTYCFHLNERFYLYQHGFNPRFWQYSVGVVVLGLTIRSAIDEGASEFDMLYGDEPYKALWASDMRPLERIELFPPPHGRQAASPHRGRRAQHEDAGPADFPEETVRFERPPRWRRLLKDAVASAISHTRSLTSLAPVARGCRPLVIGYHRVVEDFDQAAATDMPTMLVSRAMFERHVEWIGRYFEFVALDEIAAHIESGEPFSRPVATITFDDGYRDVYEHAVPTLMRVGAAATVFVVTEQLDRPCWQIHDRMYHLLKRAYDKWQQPWRGLATVLADADIAPAIVEHLHATCTNPYVLTSMLLPAISQAQAGLVMDLLNGEVGLDRRSVPRSMTWSMVRDLYRAGFTIGSHTRTHAWLANESPEKSFDEIAGSKRDLEERLSQPVRHFAYPGGQFTPAIVDMVDAAGYRYAYTACDHRDRRHPSLTIDRLMLWEGSSIASDGRFSSSILNCQAHRLWPSARRCERVHVA